MGIGVEVEGLTKPFRSRQDVTFDVPAGDVSVRTRPPGAAISPLVQSLTGLLRPERSSIIVDGLPLSWRSGSDPMSAAAEHDESAPAGAGAATVIPRHRSARVSGIIRMRRGTPTIVMMLAATMIGATVGGPAPVAHAVPAPEVEYTHGRRVSTALRVSEQDAVGYGYGIGDKVRNGEGYPQIMAEVKNGIRPNAETAANYLVSNAVGILCPALIWQLRNSAANYQPPKEP